MKFIQTKLAGAYLIELESHEDERGFFARNFCQEEFAAHGLKTQIMQSNISYNRTKGTIRGMHYQVFPHEEAKLISCIKGAVYDIIVDIRKESTTYLQWLGIELNETDYEMIYVPEGFAHGFQALENNAVLLYQMFEKYHSESARGIRWNDPSLNITWPIKNFIISEKDKHWPPF